MPPFNEVKIMKRNRESKNRIKIIQQRHMNKQQQKMLESKKIIAESIKDFGIFQGEPDFMER